MVNSTKWRRNKIISKPLKLISLVFEMDERPVCFMLYKRSVHVEGNFLLCKNKRDNVV